MRAYLLGYNHGKNDGYYSTLIERGGCENSYDESLDVEYVAVDRVLEIIDSNLPNGVKWKKDDYLCGWYDALTNVRAAVEALKGGTDEQKRDGGKAH